MNLQKISVTVLAKDSQKYIKNVLDALKPFGEVLLYDTGSTDSTMDIARTFANVRVVENRFIGFGPTHNIASDVAANDWIFSIDSDEIVTPDLIAELESLDLDPGTVYSFPRRNYFNGKYIKWCGWCPDRQIRLYNRTKTCFSEAQVHEAILSEGMRRISLKGAIIHYSYGCIPDFLTKMQSYSTLFAQQNCGKKRSSLGKALRHGWFAFIKSYILKRGFMGGYEGFVISAYNGHTAYYKYLKLYEANCRLQKD